MNQFRVTAPVPVDGVEAEHAQVSREPAQVHVQYESGLAQSLAAYFQLRCHVERFEHGIDGDSIAVADYMGERNGLAVYDDQLDLGVRDAEAFDHVFNRAGGEKRLLDGFVAPVTGKMVVEFRIKAEVGAGWRRLHNLNANASVVVAVVIRIGCLAFVVQENVALFGALMFW